MKTFRVSVTNDNGFTAYTINGMENACMAFDLALYAAYPGRDDSKAVRHHARTMNIGESYAARSTYTGSFYSIQITRII